MKEIKRIDIKSILKKVTAVVLFVVFSVICGIVALYSLISLHSAKADETATSYSNVLDDLKKDETFSVGKYPAIAKDYSLQVIQIAESANNELFIYVYQPSDDAVDLVADEIRLSTPTVNEEAVYVDYKLTLLSTQGVFDKYKVNDFLVKTDSVRYYKIVSISRLFQSDLDGELENGNTEYNVVFDVSQEWTAQTVNENVYYSMEEIETIEIVNKYVGVLCYPKNSIEIGLGYYQYDVHYLAFSTDKPIDKILEADITYKTQNVHRDSNKGYTYDAIEDKKKTLKAGDEMYCKGNGWFSNAYNWQVIEDVQSFIQSESVTYAYQMGIFNSNVTTKLTENGKKALSDKQWVFRFEITERSYWENGKGDWQKWDYTLVGDVSVLRLKFDMDGEIYNLGVIDNKQTSNGIADNETKTEISIAGLDGIVDVLIMIAVLAVAIFIISMAWQFLSPLFSMLGKWIVGIFTWIGSLFRKK